MELRVERDRALGGRVGEPDTHNRHSAVTRPHANPAETRIRLINPAGVMLVTSNIRGCQEVPTVCPQDVTVSHLVPRLGTHTLALRRYSARSAAIGSARTARQAGAAPAASATTSIVPATPPRIHGSVAD